MKKRRILKKERKMQNKFPLQSDWEEAKGGAIWKIERAVFNIFWSMF